MPKRTRGWKILVAVDGSEGAGPAIDAATRLPWPAGSALRVISVVARRAGMPETAAALRARAEAVVEAARLRLERAGLAAGTAVAAGSPPQAIVDAARRWRADVIVLGSRGLGAVRGALLGSVSASVARAAPCSVLVVKGPLGIPLRAVMAVDGSKDARRAARRLARLSAAGGAVTVVRVITPPRVASLGLLPRGVGAPIRAELERLAGEMRRRAERDVGGVARMFGRAGWQANPVVRSGDPALEVAAAASAARARLVGVGPRGATGLERLLLGSVAERLLVRSAVSLFIGR